MSDFNQGGWNALVFFSNYRWRHVQRTFFSNFSNSFRGTFKYLYAGLDHLVLFITRSKFWAYFCQNGFAFVKRTLIGVSLWKSKQTAVGHTQISRKACIPLCYEVMRDLKQAFLWKFVCGRIAEVWKWPQTLQTWAQWKQFLYWKSNSSSKKEFFIYKRRKKDRTTRSLLRSFWKWCLLWKKQ